MPIINKTQISRFDKLVNKLRNLHNGKSLEPLLLHLHKYYPLKWKRLIYKTTQEDLINILFLNSIWGYISILTGKN